MSAPEANDELFRALRALPPPEPLDDLAAERVRRRAQAALTDEKRLARPAWAAPLRRAWGRAVMPALVSATVGSYLYWAVAAASAVYR